VQNSWLHTHIWAADRWTCAESGLIYAEACRYQLHEYSCYETTHVCRCEQQRYPLFKVSIHGAG